MLLIRGFQAVKKSQHARAGQLIIPVVAANQEGEVQQQHPLVVINTTVWE